MPNQVFPAMLLLAAFQSLTALAAVPFTETQLCKAGIGALMGRSPAAMTAVKDSTGDVRLSYRRSDDGTKWSYKCRVVDNLLWWGSDPGRWRRDPADERLRYRTTDDGVEIQVYIGPEVLKTKKYGRRQLGR